MFLTVTWLSKHLYGIHDVHTVALSRDDEVELAKGLGLDDQRVALGGQRETFRRVDVVV